MGGNGVTQGGLLNEMKDLEVEYQVGQAEKGKPHTSGNVWEGCGQENLSLRKSEEEGV